MVVLDDLPVARRVAALETLSLILELEGELEAAYRVLAAGPGPGPLRATGAELAARLAAQRPRVEVLARSAGLAVPARSPSVPTPAPGERTALFAQAFERERTLEAAYRELAALLTEPALSLEVSALAAEAVRRRAQLRRLYVRYS